MQWPAITCSVIKRPRPDSPPTQIKSFFLNLELGLGLLIGIEKTPNLTPIIAGNEG